MTIRPIAFTGAMVSALLSGRKTQTRRVMARLRGLGKVTEFGQSDTSGYDWHCRDREMRWHDLSDAEMRARLPYAVGDLLYVRECWRSEAVYDDDPPRDIPFDACCVQYAADGSWSDYDPMNRAGRLRAAMHMPRWASRLTLKVTDVRVERVKQISEADAKAEGADTQTMLALGGGCPSVAVAAGMARLADPEREHRTLFEVLWDEINAPRGFGWDANPGWSPSASS